MSDVRVCHACLRDVPKDEAVALHIHFSDTGIEGHPFDEDYYYHVECYEKNVRLHR